MHSITKLCLKKPVSTVIIIVAMVIFSILTISKMNMQLTPDMEMPYIIAYCIYPGASPDDMDRLVAQELEDVGSTIEGLDTVQARCMENMCYMIYGFNYGTDVDEAYNDLQQEINRKVDDLPDDCQSPTLVVMDINAMQSMSLSVTSDGGGDVRAFVENTLDNEISSIENVASTTIQGGQEDYIRIEVIPELLSEYGLDMATLANYISNADFSMPSGDADLGTQSLNVTTLVEYDNIYDLESIPVITGKGKTIMLSDVANISYAKKDADSVSYYGSKPDVSYAITKKQGSNAVQLSRDVKEKVEELAEKYPDMRIEVTYDSAESIVKTLTTVGETLVLGVFLSMLVLFIFFGDIKASLIVGSSMPVSLLFTILLMGLCNYSLNVITMGGMVIGIGMMVDNSIVVLEMCFQKRDQGFTFEEAAYDAVKTVAVSIFASTLTTIVVYLPLAVMKGLSGQMFGPLGFTIIFSLTASFISAITLVPLCYAKYHPIEKKDFAVSKYVRIMADKYANILGKALGKKITVILITVGMIILTIALGSMIHTELMPEGDEGIVNINIDVRPGLALEKKDEALKLVEQIVAEDKDVEKYTSSASTGSSSMSISAYLIDDRSRDTYEVIREWQEIFAGYDSMDITCTSGSSSSMGGGGSSADKEVDIKSTDMDYLRDTSEMIANAIRNVDGVNSVTTDFANAAARAEIRIDPVRAMGKGVVPKQAAGALYSAQNGTDVMDLTMNETDYTVTLVYPEDRFQSVNDLMDIRVKSNFGGDIPLSEIAEVEYSTSPQTIYRNKGYYQVGVKASLDKEKKFAAMKEIDDIVAKLDLPSRVNLAENSREKMQRQELGSIMEAILIAMFLVFMVMTMQFESARYSLMIMFCIPFSLIGSFLLLFLTGSTLSMTSMMGFLMLEGIVVNNGILMVDTTNQFRESMSVELALVEAGKSRLRPILMTSLTTILSMLPMALGIGKNTEQMQSMSVVIIGGLVASTVLTLILLPTFYLLIMRRNKTEKKIKKGLFKAFSKNKMEEMSEREPKDEGVDN